MLYFLPSTLVLTLYIDVVLSLSICHLLIIRRSLLLIYKHVASGPTVLFTCNVLAMSILVPLSTVNISTTSNCQCLIADVAVAFCRF